MDINATKAPDAWLIGLAPPDCFEWLCNCYQMRCDDEYTWCGGLRGPYDPDVTATSLTADFLTFCLLAKRHTVVPETWPWRAFLAVAPRFIGGAFEKSDAHERWGGENVFNAMLGGRSLRYTAGLVYGWELTQRSSAAHDECNERVAAAFHARAAGDTAALHALFIDVGGVAAWKALETTLAAGYAGS